MNLPGSEGGQLEVALGAKALTDELAQRAAGADGRCEPRNEVPGEGVEPPRPKAAGFKPTASTGSATPAAGQA